MPASKFKLMREIFKIAGLVCISLGSALRSSTSKTPMSLKAGTKGNAALIVFGAIVLSGLWNKLSELVFGQRRKNQVAEGRVIRRYRRPEWTDQLAETSVTFRRGEHLEIIANKLGTSPGSARAKMVNLNIYSLLSACTDRTPEADGRQKRRFRRLKRAAKAISVS